MTKVYPSSAAKSVVPASGSGSGEKLNPSFACSSQGDAEILTVWTKSLLFNCNGFTVFDCKGNLVFRVDNYIAGNKGEIVLMDAAGKPLLTIRRKRLSLGDNWLVYDGETTANPQFSVKKHVNIRKGRSLAHVSSGCGRSGGSPVSKSSILYEIEGSYTQRSCAVYDQKRRKVAEIKRKEAAVGGVAMGGEVFRLIVEPQFDKALAMGLVILLDQMFGRR
ncbi:hypothetical protein UlMin_045398 [Ulmus minor]